MAVVAGLIVYVFLSVGLSPALAGEVDTSLEMRARNGDPEAQFILGDKYIKGNGYPKNLAKGAQWLTAAANNQHGQAQLSIGILYFYGWGVSKNAPTAKFWLEKAVQQGVQEANYYLSKPELGSVSATANQSIQKSSTNQPPKAPSAYKSSSRQQSPSKTSKAYDLRGIQLGISLSEFRALPYPDPKANTPIRIFCTGDPIPKGSYFRLDVYGDRNAIGVIKCKHFFYGKSYKGSSQPPSWYEAGLRVATIDAYSSYFFVPDDSPSRTPRLYEIEIRSNVDNWGTFWKGYTTKFGNPKFIDDSPTQNKMGVSYDNVIAVWGNSESMITAHKRLNRIDNSYIIYRHKSLGDKVKNAREITRGRPSDNL